MAVAMMKDNDEDKSEQKKTLKYKDGSIDLDYYNNYNLTEDLEKSFNQSGYHNEETNENLYKDVEYIDEKKEKKKKKKSQIEEAEREKKEWEEKVSNFLPTDLLTVKLKPRYHEVRYNYINILNIINNIKILLFILRSF